jgi:hypothetical protein
MFEVVVYDAAPNLTCVSATRDSAIQLKETVKIEIAMWPDADQASSSSTGIAQSFVTQRRLFRAF